MGFKTKTKVLISLLAAGIIICAINVMPDRFIVEHPLIDLGFSIFWASLVGLGAYGWFSVDDP